MTVLVSRETSRTRIVSALSGATLFSGVIQPGTTVGVSQVCRQQTQPEVLGQWRRRHV